MLALIEPDRFEQAVLDPVPQLGELGLPVTELDVEQVRFERRVEVDRSGIEQDLVPCGEHRYRPQRLGSALSAVSSCRSIRAFSAGGIATRGGFPPRRTLMISVTPGYAGSSGATGWPPTDSWQPLSST